MLVSISNASAMLGVCTKTLRRWHEKNIFPPDCRTMGGHRRYSLERLKNILHSNARLKKKQEKMNSNHHLNQHDQVALYARVSAAKQKDDLTRQVNFLIKKAHEEGYSNVMIYKDIASGLNDKRSGLRRLVRDAFSRRFSVLFITHRDRLARFGTSLLYQVLSSLDITIVEHPVDSTTTKEEKSPAHELVKDVLAILTSYSGKLYRLRRGAFT